MKDLIDRKTGRMKLIDAPVGVFVFRDEFVLKTEYMTNIDGVYIPDCYILSTGEKFWGGMKSKEDFKTKYNNLDVEVIDIMPSAHLESKRQATKTSDCISRQDAIEAIASRDETDGTYNVFSGRQVVDILKGLPSAQPEQRYTEEELRVFQHGISLSLLSKRSAQHWRYDEDTATEIEFLERLYEKVRADMRGEQE